MLLEYEGGACPPALVQRCMCVCVCLCVWCPQICNTPSRLKAWLDKAKAGAVIEADVDAGGDAELVIVRADNNNGAVATQQGGSATQQQPGGTQMARQGSNGSKENKKQVGGTLCAHLDMHCLKCDCDAVVMEGWECLCVCVCVCVCVSQRMTLPESVLQALAARLPDAADKPWTEVGRVGMQTCANSVGMQTYAGGAADIS